MSKQEHPLVRQQRMQAQLKARQVAQRSPGSPYELERNMLNAKLGSLMPGNVGDINKIVWPFWFSFNAPELAPNVSSQASFSVSQEAAFIWMSFTKVVFKRTGGGPNYDYTAIDASDETASGDADDLTVYFKDSQSSRQFGRNPMPIDVVGSPQDPTVFTTPIMFLPNANVEAYYSNSHASNIYVPFITAFGYRVRIENAQEILSLITG